MENNENKCENGQKEQDHQIDYRRDREWLEKPKHIFILSEAGKPIYTFHGSEDKLASLFGVMQALVSFVQQNDDGITAIFAEGYKIVFLVRNSLILVATSRTNCSTHQMQTQLSYLYNQILSTLTYSRVNRSFEKRKNFDLRILLSGSERIIDNFLVHDNSVRKVTNDVFSNLTNSISIMKIPITDRNNIVSSIQSSCSKIKDLIFAILLAKNQLISLVRLKNQTLHPVDLKLIFNLIDCSESFKSTESWVPICLPKFDMNGFMYAYITYLSEDCEACLILMSSDCEAFSVLKEAKSKITDKLRRNNCFNAINQEIFSNGYNLDALNIPEMVHFVYKPKGIYQIICSEIKPPYTSVSEFKKLEGIYFDLYRKIHKPHAPLKLIYEVRESEAALAWVTTTHELYAVFQPTVEKNDVIMLVDKLFKAIAKDNDNLFIKNHPYF
ncbi:MON1A family protein [Megaselia abdita]